MLIKIPSTKTIEVSLPAFFKKDTWYFMITKNETVVRISAPSFSCCICTTSKESIFHEGDSKQAAQGEEITKEQFYEVWDQVLRHLETQVLETEIKD